MGLFSKKEEEKKKVPKMPKLPELPSLEDSLPELPQLPTLPNSSFGAKFSQNAIKEAVSGKKEGEESIEEVPELPQGLPKKPLSQEVPEGFIEAAQKSKRAEPVFIRIDKFEESLKVFKKAKEKISEIEELLRNIKSIKEEEEKELTSWEEEIQSIKSQIEKIDRDVFSKVE